MKKNVITFLIVICFHSLWASIQQDTTGTAGKLSIFGNVLFSREVLQDRMGFVPGRPMPEGWPEKSLENIASFYMEQGYYFIRIDSLRWRFSGDNLVVNAEMWIHEGEVLRIGEILIIGEDEKSYRKWLSGMESRPGSIFHDTILEQDIDHILMYYENIGYPLTRVEIQSLSVQVDDTGHPFIDIVLQIHKKSFVDIGDLRSEGQQQTLEKVILRESRLKTGQPYKQKKIDMAQKYLQRLEYFATVEKPHIQFQGEKADVTFRVKEGRTNTIDGVIGYIPPKDDGQNGYVTGRLEFQFRNLLGTGRFVEAFWEKKDNYSQAMRFGYEEPWLLGWPVNLGGQFQQIIRDTTYIERHWKFYLRYRPSPTLSVEMKGGTSGSVTGLHRECSFQSGTYRIMASIGWF
ncbi:POTRA domain-containing protein [bacterium]